MSTYPEEFTTFEFITECPNAMDYEEEIIKLQELTIEHTEKLDVLDVDVDNSRKHWKVFI